MSPAVRVPQRIEREVVVSGREIHVTEAGDGPAVLMLHGGGPGASGVSNYSRNIDALAEHFRVPIPDLPGYGRSSKGVADDPFGDLAAAMGGMMAALDIECAHVIGNSLGGAVALRLALEQPLRVQRLVLMGPGGIGISSSAPTAGLKRMLAYYAGEGPSLAAVIANPPLRQPKDIEGFRRLDFLLDARLSSLHHPTLVLWGTEDRVNPSIGALELQRRMPACDVFLFSRTGHWVQWERAAEFNATVAAFLGASV